MFEPVSKLTRNHFLQITRLRVLRTGLRDPLRQRLVMLEELGARLAEKFKQSLAVVGVECGRGVEAVVARRVDEKTRGASGDVEGCALQNLFKKTQT